MIQFAGVSQVDRTCSSQTFMPDNLGTLSTYKSSGWSLWSPLSDEFNQSSIDLNKWDVVDLDCHGMSSMAYFKKENAIIDNGRLKLLAKNDIAFNCLNTTMHYSSGYVISKLPIQYGLIEIKCRVPYETALNASFWTWGGIWPGNYMTRYDEIDVFENIPEMYSNQLFRQSLLRKTWLDPPNDEPRIEQVDCHALTYNSTYSGIDFIITVEWLPTEINFYLNGHWTSGFKYTENQSWIYPGTPNTERSIFTCVDFRYACAQNVQLSLSLQEFLSSLDLSKGYEIDWIRAYKLVTGVSNYWPSLISLSDNQLSRVHSTIRLGGDSGHNGIVPLNSKITVWASSEILFDKGFTLNSGCTFEARCTIMQPSLLINPDETIIDSQ